MDKDLIKMVDEGYMYSEVGKMMLDKYGNAFWKRRNEYTRTTPSQVVNSNLYSKLPIKIVRGELMSIVRKRLGMEE